MIIADRLFQHPSLEIASRPDMPGGKKCITKDALSVGTMICYDFAPKHIDIESFETLWECIPDTMYFSRVSKNLLAFPITEDSECAIDCMNHSCDPNVSWHGSYGMSLIKDVEAGEELTFDYATNEVALPGDIWKDTVLIEDCKCGAKNCRIEIRNTDYNRIELWNNWKILHPFVLEHLFKDEDFLHHIRCSSKNNC